MKYDNKVSRGVLKHVQCIVTELRLQTPKKIMQTLSMTSHNPPSWLNNTEAMGSKLWTSSINKMKSKRHKNLLMCDIPA